jgi:hypothetical protein
MFEGGELEFEFVFLLGVVRTRSWGRIAQVL